ncbi:MAG: transcriptional repressor [Planctomycetes bacterium]|nr:transcriptional repressor [Planctomycetota bacterium]
MSFPNLKVAQSREDKFREYLASRPTPQRFTDQQRELLAHVFAKHSHFDAEELIEQLKRAKKPVSRATVYRTLTKLVDAGLLRRIELGDRTVYDHDYGYPAHDHLVCEQCNSMTEFQSDELEALLSTLAGQHQFRVEGHTLVIRGVCAACKAKRADKPRPVM